MDGCMNGWSHIVIIVQTKGHTILRVLKHFYIIETQVAYAK